MVINTKQQGVTMTTVMGEDTQARQFDRSYRRSRNGGRTRVWTSLSELLLTARPSFYSWSLQPSRYWFTSIRLNMSRVTVDTFTTTRFKSLHGGDALFVMAQNIIQLIVGWELVGVCSFALIGHWWEEKPNTDAALKAFLTNRVGDVGLLVGMIVLWGTFKTFDIDAINTSYQPIPALTTLRC